MVSASFALDEACVWRGFGANAGLPVALDVRSWVFSFADEVAFGRVPAEDDFDMFAAIF